MGKSEIKVPIVKEGKDICRIIFTEFDDGLFDIKIDSLEKPFSVQSYSLFCNRPNEILTYNNHQYLQSDISYHHGAEKKPVVVHVKKRNVKEGELQYLTLPINRIVPPSNNNIFPLPLMKIEIPDISVKGSKIYKKKGYHRLVDISNSNVVEIYMAKRNFSDNFEKYSRAWITYWGLSFEYFSTNNVLSGIQKAHTYIPSEPENRCVAINGIKDVSLMMFFYSERNLNIYRKTLQYTFIENEYAEDILLNTIIAYPPSDNNGEFSSLYLGGSTLSDLEVLSGKINQSDSKCMFGKIKTETGEIRRRYTIAQAMICMDDLVDNEREFLKIKALESAKRLYDVMYMRIKRKDNERKLLYDKCVVFANKLSLARKEARNGIFEEDVEAWLLLDPATVEEKTYAMLSKCLGLGEYILGGCSINNSFLHLWLLWDCNWDVSICGSVLNRYITEPATSLYQDVFIRPALDPVFTPPSIVERVINQNSHFVTKPIGYKRITEKDRDTIMNDENGLLLRVYSAIISENDDRLC